MSSRLARTGSRLRPTRCSSTNCRPRCLQTSALRPVQYAETAPENEPLDPALEQLLRDADFALSKSRKGKFKSSSRPVELELAGTSEVSNEPYQNFDAERTVEDDIEAWHNRSEKSSTEASFGSKYIGISSIPPELDSAIESMINGASSQVSVTYTLVPCSYTPSSRRRQTSAPLGRQTPLPHTHSFFIHIHFLVPRFMDHRTTLQVQGESETKVGPPNTTRSTCLRGYCDTWTVCRCSECAS